MTWREFLRRPEPGDDLDGCELDFTKEPNGPPVRFEPEPEEDEPDGA